MAPDSQIEGNPFTVGVGVGEAGSSTSSLHSSASPEESRRALELVISYLRQQLAGFLAFKQIMDLGKLEERLNQDAMLRDFGI